MRMTTLHEEPLGGHRSLDEEPEDSYSDSEYTAEYEQERQQIRGMGTRSRLTASKTMDSFMDVSSHSNPSYLSYTSSANANMKHLTGLATLSMSSSTSSGYGSQAVSCNNLSNEDITSMRSMSIDETPGEQKSLFNEFSSYKRVSFYRFRPHQLQFATKSPGTCQSLPEGHAKSQNARRSRSQETAGGAITSSGAAQGRCTKR